MEALDFNLILPKTHVAETRGKAYFLAGPIRGADDWQAEAVNILAHLDPGCTIICPCRWDSTHPLSKYRIASDGAKSDPYESQTDWERHWIKHAAEHGCLIFWIPCESAANPRPKEAGPYARDTYGEIARYSQMISHEHKSFKMVIGADPHLPEGFGLKQIQTNLDGDFCCHYPIWPTLEKVLKRAVKYAYL